MERGSPGHRPSAVPRPFTVPRLKPAALVLGVLLGLSACPDTSAAEQLELLLQFDDELSAEKSLEAQRKLNITPTRNLGRGLVVARPANSTPLRRVLQASREVKGLVAVERNLELEGAEVRTEPAPKRIRQWWHNNAGENGRVDADMDSLEAWNIRSDASGVIVAVLSTGIDTEHEDLGASLWTNGDEIPGNGKDDDGNGFVDDVHGFNFVAGTGDVSDDHGAGTAAAGLIGARGNNRIGIDGVCWATQIMGVKVLDEEDRGTLASLIQGVRYAVQSGAKVILTEWPREEHSRIFMDALTQAGEEGVLFVLPAGDDGRNRDSDPVYRDVGRLGNVITVAATGAGDKLDRLANHGAKVVCLAAPGARVAVPCPGNTYCSASGSLMAAAQVAGAAALVCAHRVEGPRDIRQALTGSADRLECLQDKVASGRLNLFNALLDATPQEEIERQAKEHRLGRHAYAPGEMLLSFRSEVPAERKAEVLRDLKFRLLEEIVPGSLVRVQLPQDLDLHEGLRLCRRHTEILVNEPNYVLRALETIPGDSRFSGQWCHRNTGQSGGTVDADMDTTDAWSIRTSASGAVVAVIDTGVDYDHPDLADNMWRNPGEVPGNGVDDDGNGFVDDVYGMDFCNSDSDPDDDDSHGTHCAGIIGAVGNNQRGVAGVCWDVQIMACKFLDSDGSGYTSHAIQCLNYAVQNGATVLSNSWGGGGRSQAMHNAIQTASNRGVVFVAAAGNESNDNDRNPSYPASYDLPNVISVAASDRNDGMASFSNYGRDSVHLGAPGVSILSTIPSNRYASYSGTSMACPQVSGACALVSAHDPGLDAEGIKDRLMATVDAKSAFSRRTISGGRLNVHRAISYRVEELPDLVPETVEGPDAAEQGETIEITVRIRNRGTSGTDTDVPVNCYLSQDTEISADDVPLTALTFTGGLDTGETAEQTVGVTIPAEVEDGTYYLGAIVDPGNAIEELSEANNARAANGQLAVGDPYSYDELQLNNVTAGYTGDTAPTYQYYRISVESGVTYVFETLGSPEQPSCRDTVMYLYRDWSAQTGPSGELAYNDDAGGRLYSQITHTADQTGDCYVMVRGYDGETGHFSIRATTGGYPFAELPLDSTRTGYTGSRKRENAYYRVELEAGRSFVIETSESSDGPRCEDTVLHLYRDWTASNGPARQVAANDDGGDGLYSCIQFTPRSSGYYYLRVRGYRRQAGLFDIHASVDQRSNLRIASLVANPVRVRAGQRTIITAAVENSGESSSGPFGVVVTVDGDTAVTLPFDPIAAGDSESFNFGYENVPSTPDPHVVCVTADADGEVGESDEGDNRSCIRVDVVRGPDLYVRRLAATPRRVRPGRPVTIRFTIRNRGDLAAAESSAGVYLNGEHLESFAVGALAPRATSSQVVYTIDSLPTDTARHRLVVRADESSDVDESNEGNNERAVTLRMAKPDLVVNYLRARQLRRGRWLRVDFRVKNIGNAETGRRFRARVDITRRGNGRGRLSRRYYWVRPNLKAGGTSSVRLTLRLPRSARSGRYYVRVTSDTPNRIAERNERNNVRVRRIRYRR